MDVEEWWEVVWSGFEPKKGGKVGVTTVSSWLAVRFPHVIFLVGQPLTSWEKRENCLELFEPISPIVWPK